MSKINYSFKVSERFLRYVRIDTQSDPESRTYPSTEKQKNLGRLLVQELLEMGIKDAHLDNFGYVYATLPSNTDKKVPVVCFCSHMDTSPDTTGKNVNPVVHNNYQGGDITLPGDDSQVIKVAENPELNNQKGNDIITTDGTTLLGADDKAGVAEIMDGVYQFLNNPGIKHGEIKILFTPDEEVGRGVDKVDLKKLGADFCYTLDGDTLGKIEDETFSADSMTLIITGKNIHPGLAKGKLESSIKIAAELIDALPKDSLSPETTSGREGFIHPVLVNGMTEQTTIKIIIRDFDDDKLIEKENLIEDITKKVISKYKNSRYEVKIEESYRNMKKILDKYPSLVSYAEEATRRAGVKPFIDRVRGGTDGSRLSFMGLPSPNIFAGSHSFHSKLEWVSVQDMQKAVETVVNLACIWEENS
ncbi:MAG: peptidase T [Ignavibacteria bacterium]